MKPTGRRLIVGVLALLLLPWIETALAQETPVREITRIAGDVYRFRNDFHYSVFMVTPEGVVVTDPINADAARWLKREIAKRFGLPVRYLVYSHDHADHSSGGEVFADTALVVAHENAKVQIVGEHRPTAVPQITFSDRMTIELGGKAVELVYLGLNHSDNLIVMRFPAERIVYAVDIVSRDTLPYRDFPNVYVDGLIESLTRLQSMDFDILAPGHGELGTVADVAAYRRYVEKLRAEVLGHMRAGRTLDEIKGLVTMDAYRNWGRYDQWRELNVEGMYRHLRLYRRPN